METRQLTGRQKNLNKSTNQEFTFQTDYQTPIKKKSVAGIRRERYFPGSKKQIQLPGAEATGDFRPETDQPAGDLTYHQNIAAAYSSYTCTKKRYTFKGGLRYEHTFIDASTNEGVVGVGNYGVLVRYQCFENL